MYKIVSRLIPKKIKEKMKKELTVYNANREYVLQQEEKLPLSGTVAVVTGGSGAIGRAICLKLASKGSKVYVCGRTESSVNRVVDEILNLNLLAQPFIMNVEDEESIKSAFANAFKENDKIDILVNCAGGGPRGKRKEFIFQDIEVIDSMLDSNLRGAMLCTRAAAGHMVEHNRGKIVNIGSSVAVQGKALYSEYAAAKSGLLGFTKSMALELGEYGINVNCVSPGYIKRGEYNEAERDYLKTTNSIHRVGTVEDIAEAVYFMVSKESDFITGQNLLVDGGRTLGLMAERG